MLATFPLTRHCMELSIISAIAPTVPNVGILLMEFNPAPVKIMIFIFNYYTFLPQNSSQ